MIFAYLMNVSGQLGVMTRIYIYIYISLCLCEHIPTLSAERAPDDKRPINSVACHDVNYCLHFVKYFIDTTATTATC